MKKSQDKGFTLAELLMGLVVIGVASTLFFNYLVAFRSPARDATRIITSELSRMRSEAMANTLAQRLIQKSDGTYVIQSAVSCSKAENDPVANPPIMNWTDLRIVEMPNKVADKPLTITVSGTPTNPIILNCFSSRGMADISRTITISDTKKINTISIAISGGVKTVAN